MLINNYDDFSYVKINKENMIAIGLRENTKYDLG